MDCLPIIIHFLTFFKFLTVPMVTMLSRKYQNVHYLVAIVDFTHVGSAIAPFEDLETFYWRILQQIC